MSAPIATVPLADRPVQSLSGVGKKVAGRLQRLAILRVEDLLFHLPLRYQDRTRVTPILRLCSGEQALVEGEVESVQSAIMPRRILSAVLRDESGFLTVRFFHFGAALRSALSVGSRARCFGEARTGFSGMEMIHPELKVLKPGAAQPLDVRLTPIYPTTEGLQQATLRALIAQALELGVAGGEATLSESLPVLVRQQLSLPSLRESLERVHRPPAGTPQEALLSGRDPAVKRLVFDEMLAHRLSLRRLRVQLQSNPASPLERDSVQTRTFIDGLPFGLTPAQTRVLREIQGDLARSVPMVRLLQGDVGCGKTVIAAVAMLCAVSSGRQAAIMAPTELLAEQHLASLRHWFGPLKIRVDLLSGRLGAPERREILHRVASGRAQVVVGTHAIFQADVRFADLSLVVVDEQHRFGVHQRLALRDKGREGGRVPHQLVMTATPIPRTLAMTAYADLDLSVIDELPPGRKPVKTVVVADRRRDEVIERVSQACKDGRQAYWVCTLVEESEALEAKAAEDAAAELSEELPHLCIGLAHGRQRPADRAETMESFKSGGLDLLVATTVIEVGVDVPNASLMIIENAERLGLAQLHQLRGRVGRGTRESYCLLMYGGRLSEAARSRLQILRDSNDGFEIAQRDLDLRGPGEVLGVRQTGEIRFRVVDLIRDEYLLDDVRDVAEQMERKHPTRVPALIRRWIGEDGRYGEV